MCSQVRRKCIHTRKWSVLGGPTNHLVPRGRWLRGQRLAEALQDQIAVGEEGLLGRVNSGHTLGDGLFWDHKFGVCKKPSWQSMSSSSPEEAFKCSYLGWRWWCLKTLEDVGGIYGSARCRIPTKEVTGVGPILHAGYSLSRGF